MNIENGPELAARLQEPFNPQDVDFLPQGPLSEQGQGRAVAYVDARVVATRFDEIFGPLGWSFTYNTLIEDAAVRVVRGTITIGDCVKQDIGDGGPTEPSKSAVSDALKRTAVLLGVGRYLYTLGTTWVKGKPGKNNSWTILDSEIDNLRARLPRPANMPAPPKPAPQRTEKPPAVAAAQSPAPSAPAASQASTAPPVGDPLTLAKAKTLLLVKPFGWDDRHLTEIMETAITPGIRIGQAGLTEWRALYAYVQKHGRDALAGELFPEPVGAV